MLTLERSLWTKLPFLIGFGLFTCSSMGQIICLDPGHPSENGRGSKGKKLDEVTASWRVALRSKELLKAKGYTVVLTKRIKNERVLNRRRAEIANRAEADLMVRLHCDAGSGSGIGVYYPEREGRVSGTTGPPKAVRTQSKTLAAKFHKALVGAIGKRHPDRGLMTDRQTAIGFRQGALTGSIYSKVPVLLVELAVLTNPKDEAFLLSKDGFERLCKAIAAGIEAAVPPK